MNIQIEKQKQLILEKFLAAAPFDRWDESNLIKSAQACDFAEKYYLLLFPDGINDLTQYFNDILNQQMEEQFIANNLYTKINDKIAYLIELKLALYSSHKEAIQCLLQYNLMPQNILSAQKQLWQTCDQIWYLAGDNSTDYNYYTKRALLAAVYSSSILYWLSDDSDGYQDSKKFIRRKIADIGKVNQWKRSILSFFKNL